MRVNSASASPYGQSWDWIDHWYAEGEQTLQQSIALLDDFQLYGRTPDDGSLVSALLTDANQNYETLALTDEVEALEPAIARARDTFLYSAYLGYPSGTASRANLLDLVKAEVNLYLMVADEFLIDALEHRFSAQGAVGQSPSYLRDQIMLLVKAKAWYDKALDLFVFGFSHSVGGNVYVADYLDSGAFALFSYAVGRASLAQRELSARHWAGATGPDRGRSDALAEARQGAVEGYLLAAAVAKQIEENQLDQELRALGGDRIVDALVGLQRQGRYLLYGLNPLGYDDSFVPMDDFSVLLQSAQARLSDAFYWDSVVKDEERSFDWDLEQLRSQLATAQHGYVSHLFNLTGCSLDVTSAEPIDTVMFIYCNLEAGGDLLGCPIDQTADAFDDCLASDAVSTTGGLARKYRILAAENQRVELTQAKVQGLLGRMLAERQAIGGAISLYVEDAASRKVTFEQYYKNLLGAVTVTKTRSKVKTHRVVDSVSDIEEETKKGGTLEMLTEAAAAGAAAGGSTGNVVVGVGAATESFFRSLFSSPEIVKKTIRSHTVEDVVETQRARVKSFTVRDDSLGINLTRETELLEATTRLQIELSQVELGRRLKGLMLDHAQALIELDLAVSSYNAAAADFFDQLEQRDQLVNLYIDAIGQSRSTQQGLANQRLLRSQAVIALAEQLSYAAHHAYLAAKAYEYMFLADLGEGVTLPGGNVLLMDDLYRAQTPGDLNAFLVDLSAAYAGSCPWGQFDMDTVDVSLARNVLGLTEAVLNPDGSLSSARVSALRRERLQGFLAERIQVDRLVLEIPITESHAFLAGSDLFNRKIWSGDMPEGCTDTSSGARGVSLMVETTQTTGNLAPRARVRLPGRTSLKQADGSIKEYVPVYRYLGFLNPYADDAFDKPKRAELDASVNGLGTDWTSVFKGRGVTSTEWRIELYNGDPAQHADIDFSKITDIHLTIDTLVE